MSHSHAPSVGPSALEPDPSARSLEVTARDIVVGVLIGRTVAFFDLFVFGIACALVFPHVFFPFVDETRGMLYGFVIFALGFIAQPLGSLFFMWAQRRFGRTVQLTVGDGVADGARRNREASVVLRGRHNVHSEATRAAQLGEE